MVQKTSQNAIILHETKNQSRNISQATVALISRQDKSALKNRNAKFEEALLAFDAELSKFFTAAGFTRCRIY